MSGGSYDYVSGRFSDAASTLRDRHPRQPHVRALANLLDRIADVMHDVEWADSGDTSWDAGLDAKIRAILSPTAEIDEARAAAQDAHDILAALLRGKPVVDGASHV